MTEFTVKALIIGLIMCVVLGAANAYLGLKAGMTIAATYPAAVIGMALIKAMKGSILEENFARTVGSIGESVAAGAIFTLPAFFVAGIWDPFFTPGHYMISTFILIAGGIMGIMFVALLRRIMVEDVELPFPESLAAAEIHKSGRKRGAGSKFLFGAMGLGGIIYTLGKFKLFAVSWEKVISFAKGGGILLRSPGVSPAYLGVGYIIGPKLAGLNFSGGILAWGLLAPIVAFFINYENIASGVEIDWLASIVEVWGKYVRPIAIGGMLMGAAYTLWSMRKSLGTGIARSISDVKKAATGEVTTQRIDKDISFTWIMLGIIAVAIGTFFIYNYFAQDIVAALVATLVMVIAGFFFAAVSGYLVGIIGSSNNPISGLTISTLVIAAILMVALGMKGVQGVAAVLGVAAVVCVAAAVAGEMLQDLKAGHLLGGTPWRMQIGDIIGVILSAAVMFFVLVLLHEGDIKSGGIGFGGEELPAPQASLMAILSKGIVSGEMEWILIFVGILMGIGFILMQVKSPMLVSVGMYLPLGTTFAIFIGGLFKGIVQYYNKKRNYNEAQKANVENIGILLAAGLIAGEALIGLLFAGFAFAEIELFAFFKEPSFIVSLFIFLLIGWILVRFPLKNAGKA